MQIYYGDGKGKTTAAIGIAIRSAAANFKILFIQFLKRRKSGECKVLAKFDNIHFYCFGDKCFIKEPIKESIIKKYNKVFTKVKKLIKNNDFDLCIFDEILYLLKLKILKEREIINLIKEKPMKTEYILTGNYKSKKLFEYADLITEMKSIKHYYQQKVKARKGIEY